MSVSGICSGGGEEGVYLWGRDCKVCSWREGGEQDGGREGGDECDRRAEVRFMRSGLGETGEVKEKDGGRE